MIAAFAGYTAVYALNDIVDYRNDKKKISQAGFHRDTDYLDATYLRHPLARGYLTMSEAAAWAGGCILEILYCRLLQVSHLRTLVSGLAKTLGGLAAVFAVDASPAPDLLLLIFFWLFFWEIGAQNVPADWHDIEEDIATQSRTVPVSLGPKIASIIVLTTLCASLLLSGVIFQVAD